LTAPRGKITALAGQIGSGATEVARAIAGLVHNATGALSLGGQSVPLGSTPAARRAGIMFVSEDRAVDGLFHRSVLENLVASDVPRHTRSGLLSWRRMRNEAGRLAELVGVDKGRLAADAFDLSGGNQQKVLFGRVSAASEQGALVMNEPTRGVDVGARAEIYALMRDLCRQGYALLMTSSDLEEVAGMADTVVTLYRGRQIGCYDGAAIDIATILSDITHPVTPGERAA
jgi:ABC-type sugar transport system ATPase subunit